MSAFDTIKVGDVMTGDVHMIDRMATVTEAIDRMRQHRVSSLIVDRRDGQDEFGLLVVSDIARQVIAANRAPDRVNVYEVMSKPLLTLPEDMSIRYAVRFLSNFGLSRGLVVGSDNRTPIGIATLRDMVLRYGSQAG